MIRLGACPIDATITADGTRKVTELVALAKKPGAQVRAFLWSLVAAEILAKRK